MKTKTDWDRETQDTMKRDQQAVIDWLRPLVNSGCATPQQEVMLVHFEHAMAPPRMVK